MTRIAVPNEELADYIDAAADLLDKGWVQGRYEDWDWDENVTKHCAVGALSRALGDLKSSCSIRFSSLMRAAADRLVADEVVGRASVVEWPDSIDALIGWNDQTSRTQSQVVDLFRRTAKDLRS